MEKDQFNITRKFHLDGRVYFTVVFGWVEDPRAGQTTKVFSSRLQAIRFINEELQKEAQVTINGVVYPSHIVKIGNRMNSVQAPVTRLVEGHSLHRVGIRWIRYNSVEDCDGALIYYHKDYWRELA